MSRVGDQTLELPGVQSDEANGDGGVPGSTSASSAAPAALLTLRPSGRRDDRRRLLLARRGDRWDAERVAEHLMSRRGQMVRGLRHRSPWAGLDIDTLESCFGAAAALVVELASTGKREDWRTAEDLEKAQIAAYRNQCLDHWKHVNAQRRAGDRLTVAFDPERHAVPDAQLERLFVQPDVIEARRDLLAEMEDPRVRAFWRLLLEERLTFKLAGDRLGLTKAEVGARTRAGRRVLFAYRDRRDSGDLCVERGLDVAAWRAGSGDAATRERAEAHLESCYACSLVHAPRTSAFGRGMLALTPMGLLVRLSTRVGEAATGSAARWADAGAGARVAAGGLAAAALAGSAIGLEAASEPKRPAARPAVSAPAAPARGPAAPAVRGLFRTPGLFGALPAAAAEDRTPPVAARPRRAAAQKRKPRAKDPAPKATTQAAPAPAPAAPAPAAPTEPEFSVERGGQVTPSPSTSPTPAASEFAAP